MAERRDGFQRHVAGALGGLLIVLLEQQRTEAGNGYFTIDPSAFVNDGEITVAASETLDIDSQSFTYDSGATITAEAGSALDFGGGTLTNAGTITVSDATLGLGSSDATVDNTGLITVTDGTLDLGRFTNTGPYGKYSAYVTRHLPGRSGTPSAPFTDRLTRSMWAATGRADGAADRHLRDRR